MALLVLAGAACTGDEPTTPPPPGEGAATESTTDRGRRRRPDRRLPLPRLRRPRRAAGDQIVRRRPRRRDRGGRGRHPRRGPSQRLDVTAAGAVAWSEAATTARRRRRSSGRPAGRPVPSRAIGPVPRWLADGRRPRHLAAGDGTAGSPSSTRRPGRRRRPPRSTSGHGAAPAPAGPDHVVFPRPMGEPYGPEGAEVVRAAWTAPTRRSSAVSPAACCAPWTSAAGADGRHGGGRRGLTTDARLDAGSTSGRWTTTCARWSAENDRTPTREHAFVVLAPGLVGRRHGRGLRPVRPAWRRPVTRSGPSRSTATADRAGRPARPWRLSAGVAGGLATG